ncbi:outer membrane protein [Sphingomonas jatrophae]|uniref:Outer membrane immunogenic protein n=1 Tax=Sphingomonas jatrophae TaxID=1166337 RepID=A0A1I6LNI1_9SPHN|nr:porin family protein [Sphingomonas jatrophae]SFS05015.1 outer membrane immunogenic protein [Sphingomonas jatrophae]
MRSVAFPLALLAGVAAASPAFAQADAPFTGPRIEGLVGWDHPVTNPGHDDAVTYGVAAGYDMQMGGALVGIEAEAMDSDAKSCVGAETVANPRVCLKAGRDLYIGGRVGTVVGGRALLYAKAGYTNARVQLNSDDGIEDVRLDKTNLDGARVGAGVEYAVGPNSFVKAEYRYSNYEAGLERHQALGGFGFRF